ncbi:MAG TPA: ribosome biogenesis GTP-binding protein YihA/YsxC [Gemmatimonadales bacterium]|nr:ribosome biogenesis GTP-binding protein YihA/YsxC [Gemmatimonadales bacterium]
MFVGSYPAADFVLAPSRPEVAFVGRSNVGKSSLLNALAQRRRLAHTSSTPGKTRACNVFDVDGRYYLVDLPGYGYAAASKRTRDALGRLLAAYFAARLPAGTVWLLDVRRDPSPDDRAMAALLAERRVPVLVALTKADKIAWGQRRARRDAIRRSLGVDVPENRYVFTSARTREGVVELREAIERLVES